MYEYPNTKEELGRKEYDMEISHNWTQEERHKIAFKLAVCARHKASRFPVTKEAQLEVWQLLENICHLLGSGEFILESRRMDSAIVSALKNAIGSIRIEYGYRWLVWDSSKWVVYEKQPYQRKTSVVLETDDEQAAVDKLLEG